MSVEIFQDAKIYMLDIKIFKYISVIRYIDFHVKFAMQI